MASYQRRDELYTFLRGTDDKRNRDTVGGEVAVALSRSFSIYGSGSYLRQLAPERPEFKYDEQRFSGGIRFKGQSRVAIFAEVGQQEVDFFSTAGVEEYRVVFRGGIDTTFGDVTSLSLSGGRDAFGEPEMQAILSHAPDHGAISLMVRRSTEKSFSRATAGRTFQATLVAVNLAKDLGRRLRADVQSSFFRIQSGAGDLSQDDKTYVVTASLDYTVRRWLQFGASYRYATRVADLPENEFDSNRAGLSVVFVY